MPRVVGGSLVEHRKEMRRRAFDAFAQLMYERGYDAITLADIAESAGIARTSMYNYFPDKESLLLAYTEYEMEHFVATLQLALAELENPIARLREFVRAQLLYFSTHHLPPGSTLRSVLSDDGYARVLEHAATLDSMLREILRDAVDQGYFPASRSDVSETVPLIMACIARSDVSDLSGPELDAAIGTTVDFVLRAVGAISP